MLFADWFGDLLGNACGMVLVIGICLFWALGGLMKSLGDALQNEDVRDAARFGIWLFSDDDDDDDD